MSQPKTQKKRQKVATVLRDMQACDDESDRDDIMDSYETETLNLPAMNTEAWNISPTTSYTNMLHSDFSGDYNV